MSPEKQRIAIATACGWTRGHTGEKQWVNDPHGIRRGWASMRAIADGALPDYLNDKNAMQEVKKVLWDKGLMLEFVNQLADITYSAMGFRWEKLTTDDHLILVANATAEQEAEAFLRTLGLWEEDANTTKSVSPTPPATEESSVTLSESFRDGTTYTRSYQVFLPTPKPIQTKPIFTTPNPT